MLAIDNRDVEYIDDYQRHNKYAFMSNRQTCLKQMETSKEDRNNQAKVWY